MRMAEDWELDALEDLFAQARTGSGEVPEPLRDRVLDQALAHQAALQTPPPARRAEPIWRQLQAALGGWTGLGGLVTACAAGVWLGFAPPPGWTDPATVLMGQSDSFGLFQGEEIVALLDAEEG